MSSDRGKLGGYLGEVIHWRWDEFVKAEHDPQYSGIQAAIFKLVRTCSDGKLSAIKLAIDRVDGKIETPIKVEYPKVWLVFPEAKSVELGDGPTGYAQLSDNPATTNEVVPVEEKVHEEPEPEKVEVATMTLRETLRAMADQPRHLPHLIHEQKKKVETALAVEGTPPVPQAETPLVKSVIAANLLLLANEAGKFEAITEIFDQIDGKLVETLHILGDDLYLTQYAEVAPAGSIKNEDGVYMIESQEAMATWKRKLSSDS